MVYRWNREGEAVVRIARSPRRIGRWRLIRPLGAGGMGAVYLGESEGECAAVKVVHPGFAADAEFRGRFRREVEISSRVDGPHLARLVEADPDADEPWLASTFVSGPTLHQHVSATGPMGETATCAVALALASALRDIHAAEVVHRDLKPSNVILSVASPVVIDFGIAAAADATALTSTGSILGSVGWMAPQQIRGLEVGPAVDVFAWGATVSYTAAGRPPFGTGRAEAVAYRVVHEEAVLPALPEPLGTLVEASLAKEAADRPTADELVEELLAAAVSPAPSVAATVARTWATGTEGVPLSTADMPTRRARRPLDVGGTGLSDLLDEPFGRPQRDATTIPWIDSRFDRRRTPDRRRS